MNAALPPPDFPARPSWPVTLDYGPLRLRALRRRDRREWTELRGRNWSWLSPWEPTMPPGASIAPADFSRLVKDQNRAAKQGACLPWALSWIGDGADTLIGAVHVANIIGGSAQLAQIGYWIDRDMAGRGLMPVAVALAGDYCFEVLGLHRLEIVIRPENQASLRVVAKLGFSEEGPRPAYLHIDNAWRDHRVFALRREQCGPGLLARCAEPEW